MTEAEKRQDHKLHFVGDLGTLLGILASVLLYYLLPEGHRASTELYLRLVISLFLFVWITAGIQKYKDFLCSTSWAREQDFTTDQIKLFCRRNAWTGIGVPGIGVLIVVLLATGTYNFVKLRRSQQPRNLPQAANAVGARVPTWLSFGPVIERVIQNNTETDLCLIDLDRNKVFAPVTERDGRLARMSPNRIDTQKPESAARNGIDAVAMTRKSGDIQGLIGFDLQVVPVPEENWDNITSAAFASLLRSVQPLPETFLRAKNEEPATFLFKTRERGAGILQITGFTDNPRALKFRYKLGHGTFPPQPTQIDFKFLKVEVPKGSHYIRLHFERDTNPGLGFEVTQGLSGGPNGEVPQPGFIDHRRKKWVGVRDGNVLEWKLPQELTADEVRAAAKQVERNAKRSPQLSEGASLEFAHVKHRDRWDYILIARIRRESAPALLGPAVERLLRDAQSAEPGFLDLETGRTLTQSEVFGTNQSTSRFPTAQMQPDVVSALSREGIDIGGNLDSKTPGLFAWDCTVHGIGQSGWDAADWPDAMQSGWGKSLRDIFNQLPAPASGVCNVLSGEPPQTWLLKTRNGRQVVLQITGFLDNPRGVKIRYKLARSATAATSFGEKPLQAASKVTEVSEPTPAETAKQSPHNSGAAIEGETVLHHAFTADALLDLDHGKRLGLPPDSEQWDRVRLMMWLASAGVEVAVLDYGDDASGWGLATRRGLCRIDDLFWDSLVATNVQNALASGRPGLEQIDSDGNKFSIYHLLVGLPPISFALTTSEGRLAAFQITGFTDNPRGVKIRYKLVQNSANQAAELPAISEAALAEPPKLRFLAWQDEWKQDESKTDQPGRAWHPDGSGVSDTTELRLLRAVSPMRASIAKRNPRFLHLWFSHPLFDSHSLSQVALLDGADQPIPHRAASSVRAANADGGNQGWITYTPSAGEGDQLPRTATIRLRYTVGPLERQQQIDTDNNNTIALEGGSELNGVGQDRAGKAFAAIAVDATRTSERKFGVIAVTKNGRELESITSTGGNSDGRAVSIARFVFDAPLSDISHFRVGTRPIRMMEWKDVVLDRKSPAPRPIAGKELE
jgi:hypothetical protein